MTESIADRNPFERLAAEFADRLRRGEHPSLTEYVERYPEHAADIRELFPALALVEHYKPARQELDTALASSGPDADGTLPTHLGDYRILRSLGEGGMGVVYEAVRESLKNHVALKVMHPHYRHRANYLRRFHIEARSAAGLHHTNIVSVFDYGEHDHVFYYAMQYIAGQSLDKVLEGIRQLRCEPDGAPTGETVTLACHEKSGPLPDDVAGERNGPDAILSLGRSITLGLLTGRFASPGGGEAATEAGASPTCELAVDRGKQTAGVHSATATGFVVSEPCRPSRGTRRPRTPEAQTADQFETAPSPGSSGSLTGKIDIRYYREVARLGAQVADALAYAHKRGVLHRDIKPSNLILDSLGNAWVTDFGLAKFEDGEDLSQSREMVGTLRFMAPERFRGISDRRGDLYSLGATLYELLTLRHAFEGKDELEIIRRVQIDAPAPPRQFDPRIPRDLETIVLKALAKEPNDRFEIAEEMSAELRRFVENRPIRSRPIPLYQQFWRWCKRNPWLATANISAAMLTTILAIVSTAAALVYRDRNERVAQDNVRIQSAERQAREQLFGAFVAQGRAGRLSHQMGQRFDSLDALDKAARLAQELKLPRDRLDSVRDEAIACMALPDLKPIGRSFTKPPGIGIVVAPTRTRYALQFPEGTISIHALADDSEIARFQTRGVRDFWVFRFSPDGRFLAATQSGDSLLVWDIDSRAIRVQDPGRVGRGARFSPDSKRLAVAREDGELLLYDLANGRLLGHSPGRGVRLAFHPDGSQIAVIDNVAKPPVYRILEGTTLRQVRSFPLRAAGDDVAWSPDGATLAVACLDFKIDTWDAATGVRRATLEGHDNSGLSASFHPAGALLASTGWEGRLRFWDPILGRQWFHLTGYSPSLQFSQDGRIVVARGDTVTTYQVDPALEYRTLAHAPRQPMDYALPSVRHDGRLLAVGSNRGAVIWDLARGVELAYLPIGNSWSLMFEPSGDLLTNGTIGVQRWPIRLDRAHGMFQIGPPRQLLLPASSGAIAEDRSGRILAKADRRYAYVMTPERTFKVGPLADCRGVAVSPDGQWLATSSFAGAGAQVWRIADGAKVADLPIKGNTAVLFSPDGRWLAVGNPPLRLWEVGKWRERQTDTNVGLWFSPDGRLTVTVDFNQVISLVDFETGRTLARLASPDQSGVAGLTFSPDGSRLVTTTKDRPTPAVHVWDLRAIRKNLAKRGLDYDAPAFPVEDPASASALPFPPLRVDYGPLKNHVQHVSENASVLLERYTNELKNNPDDPDLYHHRAHAYMNLARYPQAIADLSRAIVLRPADAHYRLLRASIYSVLDRYKPALADLEAVLASAANQPAIREKLALCCNNLAWGLANAPARARDPQAALRLAHRAVELLPDEGIYLNPLGVAQYRAGEFQEAIATLERSQAANRGMNDGFDLFFLAMVHHRLGHDEQARACYDRAVRSLKSPGVLTENELKELAVYQAEAGAMLAGDLPRNVFAAELRQPARKPMLGQEAGRP